MIAGALLLAPAAQATQVYLGSFSGATQTNISGTLPGFVGTPPGFGKVDKIHSGDNGVTCGAGYAACLSMESSDGHYGQITTIDPALGGAGHPAVMVLGGSTVTVSFEVSGNQRAPAGSDPDRLNATIRFFGALVDTPVTLGGAWSGVIDPPSPAGGIGTSAFLAPSSPFQRYTMSFVAPQDLGLSFTLKSGPITNVFTGADGFGPILDYVAIDVTSPAAVPEPATWAMMLMGFGGLGAALRRRRAALV